MSAPRGDTGGPVDHPGLRLLAIGATFIAVASLGVLRWGSGEADPSSTTTTTTTSGSTTTTLPSVERLIGATIDAAPYSCNSPVIAIVSKEVSAKNAETLLRQVRERLALPVTLAEPNLCGGSSTPDDNESDASDEDHIASSVVLIIGPVGDEDRACDLLDRIRDSEVPPVGWSARPLGELGRVEETVCAGSLIGSDDSGRGSEPRGDVAPVPSSAVDHPTTSTRPGVPGSTTTTTTTATTTTTRSSTRDGGPHG